MPKIVFPWQQSMIPVSPNYLKSHQTEIEVRDMYFREFMDFTKEAGIKISLEVLLSSFLLEKELAVGT